MAPAVITMYLGPPTIRMCLEVRNGEGKEMIGSYDLKEKEEFEAIQAIFFSLFIFFLIFQIK